MFFDHFLSFFRQKCNAKLLAGFKLFEIIQCQLSWPNFRYIHYKSTCVCLSVIRIYIKLYLISLYTLIRCVSVLLKISVDKCVDKLVKFDSSRSLQMIQSTSQALNDEDADVLVESEEIQPQMSATNIEMQSSFNQETEKQPQWPSNPSFASCLQNNVGFSATNPGFSRNSSPHVKQPRISSNPIEKHPDTAEIIREIENNNRIMIIMRGNLKH